VVNLSAKSSSVQAFEKLEGRERAAIDRKAEEIIEEHDLDESPEFLAIGTSELGEDFADTSARGENADETGPEIVQEMSDKGGLIVQTGWDEAMFYDHVAPEHGLEEVDAVLESGAKIAWHEDGERKTEIVGDEEALRETTEDIWSSAVEEAAEEGYKIHAQGNDVGAAVYIEAHSPERGDLENTQQAVESEENFDLEEIAQANTDFEILEEYDSAEVDEAIRFSNSEKNRVEFYEAWKNNAPLSGLRFEKKDGDIVAYRDDNEDKDITEEEAKEYMERITPDDAHQTWNNDWNSDIMPDGVPSKFQGLQALADKKGKDSVMIYADKSSDLPEDAKALDEYEGLTVLASADRNYEGEDPASDYTNVEFDYTREAALTMGAINKRLTG
jgi:hypothetical protein